MMQASSGAGREFNVLARLAGVLVITLLALSLALLPSACQCEFRPNLEPAYSLAIAGGHSSEQPSISQPNAHTNKQHHNQHQHQHLSGQPTVRRRNNHQPNHRRRRRHHHHHHHHHRHRHHQAPHDWDDGLDGIEPFAAHKRRAQFVAPLSAPNPIGAEKGMSAKFKRQVALDLAVNRLHILESLDAQLRQFADSARPQSAGESNAGPERLVVGADDNRRDPVKQIPSGHSICHLPLARSLAADGERRRQANLRASSHDEATGGNGSGNESDDGNGTGNVGSTRRDDDCLADPLLRRQIPPYMLNLYHQLVSESRTLADAVRLMPYKSLVVRSFRQPPILNRGQSGQSRSSNHQNEQNSAQKAYLVDDNDLGHNEDEEEPNSSVVVELSAIKGAAQSNSKHDDDEDKKRKEEEDNDSNSNNNQRSHNGLEQLAQADWQGIGTIGDISAKHEACDLSQRLMPANERRTLCFRFQISEQLRTKINGSLEASDSAPVRERLVEAELHLFKLPPELLLAANKDDLGEVGGSRQQQSRPHRLSDRRQTTSSLSNHSRSSLSSSNLYHLKTNLLEVSLYQILPKRRANKEEEERWRRNGNEQAIVGQRFDNKSSVDNKDFPLRLLDIRRIDMESSGWETFYVKRAVEDWMRDSSLNLGLVIKAKSMFEEPIKIGLIRFADSYDHHMNSINNNNKRRRASELRLGIRGSGGGSRHNRKEVLEFDLSHQPILVIYTTSMARKDSQSSEELDNDDGSKQTIDWQDN